MLPKSNNDGTRHVQRGTNFRSIRHLSIKIPFVHTKNMEQEHAQSKSNRWHCIVIDLVADPRNFRFAISLALSTFSTGVEIQSWAMCAVRGYAPPLFRFFPRKEKPRGNWKKRNLVKSWPSMPSIDGRRISRAGVRESSVSLRRVRNNLLNYRMPKVASARREAGRSGEEYYTRGLGAWTRGRNRVMMRERYISRNHARPCNSLPLTKIDR